MHDSVGRPYQRPCRSCSSLEVGICSPESNPWVRNGRMVLAEAESWCAKAQGGCKS